MPTNLFLYIAINLILLQLMSLELLYLEWSINIICAMGIATLGVAHGSIDDILHGAGQGKPRIFFIIKYIVSILLFGLLWLTIPNVAFFIFLAASAFHFGQTQLIELNINSRMLSSCLYFLWGSFVILLMFTFNREDLLGIDYHLLALPQLYYDILGNARLYLVATSLLLLALFAILFINKRLSTSLVLREFYLLFLITCSFMILKPFIAFSVFFILIHSMQAIQQEFEFCKQQKIANHPLQFILLFLPLTISSLLVVGGFIAGLSYFNYSSFIPFALLILLSCVTIPHCFVMDKFYRITTD